MRLILVGLLGIYQMMLGAGTIAGLERDVKREILLKFKSATPQERMDQLMKEFGLEVLERYAVIENLFLCRTRPGENRARLLKALNSHPDIDYAEANQKVEALDVGS